MLLASSFALALAAPLAPAVPQPVARSQPEFEIELPVTLDDRYLGDLSVKVQGDEVSFDAERFLNLLRADLTPPSIEAISARIKNGRLTPSTATTSEIEVRYDSTLQEIHIRTVNSARQRRLINFRTSPSLDNSPISPPAKVSAFITGAVALDYVWENKANGGGQTGRLPMSGTLDFGGRIGGEKGIAFISRQSLQEGSGTFLRRNETQLIYDDVGKLLRITAGDLRYRGTNFQSLPRLGGITIERFFGLEPSRVYRPISQTAFELERSSTVEVRVNGVALRQLLLQPGRYDLRDLPLTQGANDLELVVRDDTGREQVISSRNFFDFNLLEPGVSDFSFSLGVRSRTGRHGVAYSDSPAASGFYRRGFSSRVTAGGDIQFDRQGVTAGASLIWASPVGIFRLEAAGSKRKSIGTGAAVDVGYSVTGRFAENNWRWNATINAQYQTARFSTLSDFALPANGILQTNSLSVNANAQVNNQRLSLTASGQYDRGRGTQPNRASGIVGFTYSVTPKISVGAFARYADTGFQKDKGGFFQINWRLSRNQNLRANYDTIRKEAATSYRYSPANNVGSTSVEVSARRNQARDSFSLSGSAFHTGNRFEAFLQHDVFTTANLSSDRVQTTRASVSSSLVLAGGKFAIARPVREGFAIVSGHSSLERRKILVDPTESGARAKSGGLGPAVVPDLSSYNRSSLYVDVRDLPPGYDLGSGQFGIKAPLYAGYNLVVGSEASVTMTAKVLQGKNLTPVALTGGKLVSVSNPAAEPIAVFTNRNGRLAGTGLKPGKYRLTLFTTPPFEIEIEIPAKSSSLVDIGELRIAEQ
jgi:outer membrane usher protein